MTKNDNICYVWKELNVLVSEIMDFRHETSNIHKKLKKQKNQHFWKNW